MNITFISQMVELAEASYANLTKNLEVALIEKDEDFLDDKPFSTTQAQEFINKWEVVSESHQPDTETSDFSATLFQGLAGAYELAGEYVLAIRGTAGEQDLLTDGGDIVLDGLAVDQIIDMYNYYKKITSGGTYQAAKLVEINTATNIIEAAALKTIAASDGSLFLKGLDALLGGIYRIEFETKNDGLGIISSDTQLHVTGHSLGGHLAAAFSRLFPNITLVATMVNGAGFSDGLPLLGNSFNITNLFQRLGGDSSFDVNKITNYIGAAGWDFVSQDWFIGLQQPGTTVEIETETYNHANTIGHGAGQMTNVLAVMSLFSELSQANPLDFSSLNQILQAASTKDEETFERLINNLARFFSVAEITDLGAESTKEGREALYQTISAIRDAIYISQGNLEPIYQGLTVTDITAFTKDDLINFSQDPDRGLAYRYALHNLNPFVIEGLNAAANEELYGPHNQNGELDLANFSDNYLEDRARFLTLKNTLGVQDKTVLQQSITGRDYIDNTSGLELKTSSRRGGLRERYIFGNDESEDASKFNAGNGTDHLYGGGGDDTLQGKGGNDYLEGGKGTDTYVYETGDGFDTIYDSDGLWKIKWNGVFLTGAKTLTDNSYYDAEQKIRYQYQPGLGGKGKLTITEDGVAGGIVILDYQPEQSALNLDSQPVDPVPVDYSLLASLDEPAINYRSVAYANDVYSSIGIYDFQFHDFELMGLNGQRNGLFGAHGNDRLIGADQGDHLSTSTGDDWVDGGAGNDWIAGGWGVNTLLGGEDDDILNLTYIFNPVSAKDGVIEPYNLGPPIDLLVNYEAEATISHISETDRLTYQPLFFLEDKTWTDGSTFFSLASSPQGKVPYLPDTYNDESGASGPLLGTFSVQEDGQEVKNYEIILTFEEVEDESLTPDFLDGGDGDDLLVANESADFLLGGSGNDKLVANGGDDILFGGSGDDGLIGGAGNDLINGGLDMDILYGEDGNDLLIGGEGNDFLAGDNYFLAELLHGDDELYGGAGEDELDGNGGNDRLYGGDDNDRIWGGTGEDDLSGGSGNDDLYGGDDTDYLQGDAGDDTLFGQNGDDFIYGNAGKDELQGGEGDDLIDGGTGDDQLWGEQGEDAFVFRAGDGVDVINDPESVDRIRFVGLSIYQVKTQSVVGGNGENFLEIQYGDDDYVYLNGGLISGLQFEFDDQSAYSINEFIANTLSGSLNATLPEWGGTLEGGSSNDSLYGNSGDDTLIGNDGNDSLPGFEGADYLDGGKGTDSLTGGVGNDTYFIRKGDGNDSIYDFDQTAGNQDQILFAADIVPADISLNRVVDDLVIELNDAESSIRIQNHFLLNGAEFPNQVERIVFDDGTEWDASYINSHLDTHIVGAVDHFIGTSGDDVYLFDNVNDTVAESVNGGYDTVRSYVISETLPENIEQLELLGNSYRGAGNSLDNVIVGNKYGNYLDGKDGNDQLIGGKGDDTYVVSDSGDSIIENPNEGIDTVLFEHFGEYVLPENVENLTHDSNYHASQLRGNDLDNIIKGRRNAGGDLLDGGEGTDLLVGGSLHDTYVIDNHGDVIADFDGVYWEGGFYQANEFGDDVTSSISYSLEGTLLFGLMLQGDGPLSGTGNEFNNSLTGNVGDSLLDGKGGDDILYGHFGNNVLRGGAGDDSYYARFDFAGNRSSIIYDESGENDIFRAWKAPQLTQFGITSDYSPDYVSESYFYSSGLSLNHLSVTQQGDDLHMDFKSADGTTHNSYTIQGWFTGHKIERFQFESDLYLTAEDIEALIVPSEDENHAPVVNIPITDLVLDEDASVNFQIPTGTFLDQDAGDSLTLSATLEDGSALPGWISFNTQTNTFSGTPGDTEVGTLNIKVTAIDNEGLSVSDTFSLAINDVNAAPEVSNAIADQQVSENESFSFTLPDNTFTDIDVGDNLTLSASLEDGSALPGWISFDAETNTFNGTTEIPEAGALTIKVTATDGGGLSVSDTFSLSINDVNPEIIGTDGNDNLAGTQYADVIDGADGDDTLGGGAGNDILDGGQGDDYLFGGSGDDHLIGGTGNDYQKGEDGNDTYQFGRGDGQDTINNYALTPDGFDVLEFNAGINEQQLWFEQDGLGLRISLLGTEDNVTIFNWYEHEKFQPDEIVLETGEVLLANQVDQLVQAMASFNPPSSGEMELTGQLKDELAPVIAASWQAA